MEDSSFKLWKNQRVIDHNGLVVPEERERLFENTQACYLLEDLLFIYQRKGLLKTHFMHYTMSAQPENETITYKAYVNYRCVHRDRKEGKQRVTGQFYILYRILRLKPEKVRCHFPFLILFDACGGEVTCGQCGEPHVHRITESSFYVIRTQFVYQMMRKIEFMRKFASYEFTPHNSVSTVKTGDTVFEYVRDHNYEPSYYFERCQRVLVDCLRLAALRRGMDCEGMRWDEMGEEFASENRESLQQHHSFFKLKYMCRKCEGKEIWTTRNAVIVHYAIVPLTGKNFELMRKQSEVTSRVDVFDGGKVEEKYRQRMGREAKEREELIGSEGVNPQEKMEIQTLFKTDQRRLDRSIKNEVDEYEQFEGDFRSIGQWHRHSKEYKYPRLVLFHIKVPKMKCQRCKKEKDGLIYITNLIDEAHSTLNRKLLAKVAQLSKEVEMIE